MTYIHTPITVRSPLGAKLHSGIEEQLIIKGHSVSYTHTKQIDGDAVQKFHRQTLNLLILNNIDGRLVHCNNFIINEGHEIKKFKAQVR